ncbi:MAG TPA: hypothetical protein VHO50_07755 [Bacteroidales bacterium]|nr:hypothetical protein [Bacteroidales bacterium]
MEAIGVARIFPGDHSRPEGGCNPKNTALEAIGVAFAGFFIT